MRKNKMMRLASCLLVLTLLTTSVISGTFAKYTTTGSINDTARVAKWGVVITGSGSLYGTQYLNNDQSEGANKPTVSTTADDLSVSYSGTDIDVVAPGTESSTAGLSFSISGTPEVRTNVKVTVIAQDIYLAAGTYAYATIQEAEVTKDTFDAKKSSLYTKDETTLTYSKVAVDAKFVEGTTYYELTLTGEVTVSADYYPVTYTNKVASGNTTFNGKTKITEIAEQIATNVKTVTDDDDKESSAAKVSYSREQTLDPNTDLVSKLHLDENAITWEWKYSEGDDQDKKDTILGDLMALNAASTDGQVVVKVYKTTNEGDTIAVLTVDSDTGIVSYTTKDAESKEVVNEAGSIKTSFEITLTATQVNANPETTAATTEETTTEETTTEETSTETQ